MQRLPYTIDNLTRFKSKGNVIPFSGLTSVKSYIFRVAKDLKHIYFKQANLFKKTCGRFKIDLILINQS